MPLNNAYVTLVTNPDFVKGARALARSILLCGTQFPLIVMTTFESDEIDELEEWGAQILSINHPSLSDTFQHAHARERVHVKNPFTKGNKPEFHSPLNNFAKLRLWQLTQFDRVVFLDADTIMLKSCDKLFSYPEFSAAPNVYESLSDFYRLNSGVFVASPSVSTYNDMLRLLDAPDAYWPRTDQTFLQRYFPDWHGLPHTFNTLQYIYFQLPQLWNPKAIHVLHYQYEKPWQPDHPKAEQLRPLIDLWWEVYEYGKLPSWLS